VVESEERLDAGNVNMGDEIVRIGALEHQNLNSVVGLAR